MATVTIENLEVARIIQGYGFRGVETKQSKSGEPYRVYYTVWTKEPVNEGDVVDVEGDLSVKLEEFTGRDNQPKKVAAIHVNNGIVVKQDAPF